MYSLYREQVGHMDTTPLGVSNLYQKEGENMNNWKIIEDTCSYLSDNLIHCIKTGNFRCCETDSSICGNFQGIITDMIGKITDRR